MNSPLRVGVVGVGYLGSVHAEIYSRMPGVTLAGVADVRPEVAREIGERLDCPYYTEASELLGNVDAASIAVPTSMHREVAIPFLEAGKDLLVEKPLASNVIQASELIQLAESKRRVLLVGHLERFNAGGIALAERVSAPRFIEVHRLSTFLGRSTDVDVVSDLMIHDIDIVLSRVPSELVSVAATGSAVLTEHLDIANARLEFANGTVANVTASRVSAKKFRRIRVFSENGYHALNFIDQQIDIVRKTEPAPGQVYPGLSCERLAVEHRSPLEAELEHFIDVVSERQPAILQGREIVRALEVAELVHAKIQQSMH